MNRAVVIHLSSEVERAIPMVAEDLGLTKKEPTPEVIEEVFEILLLEHALRVQAKSQNDHHHPDAAQALADLLDPNVSVMVRLATPTHVAPSSVGKTLLDQYDEHQKRDPHDPWIVNVENSSAEDKLYWRMALALVYQSVVGKDRREFKTWALIERTVRMVKQRPLDTTGEPGHNDGSVPDSPDNPTST